MSLGSRLLTLFVLLAVGSIAFADQISIAGDTSGVFSATDSNTWDRLSFTGRSFSATTNLPGNAYISNIGTFTLGTCGQLFCSDDYEETRGFNLEIEFALPLGIDGTPTTFVADMSGTVGRFFGGAYGDVDLAFDNWRETFTYHNAAGSGQFTFALAGGSFQDGHLYLQVDRGTETLAANITGATFTPGSQPPPPAAVPEPTSILLLGSVLSGLGLLWRKKRA